MKNFCRSASFAALIVGSLSIVSQGATAASVSIADEVFTGNAPLLGTPTPVSGSVTGNFIQSITGSIVSVNLSPYLGNTDGLATTGAYSVLGAGNGNGVTGSATYDVNSSTLMLLWGSPDSYNQVEFFSGPDGMGTPEGTFTGTDLACFDTTCNQTLFDLVTFTASGGDIGSVVLTNSTSPAFEFGIDPDPVPLPPTIYLFGSVLVGAFWLGRRKRSAVSGLGSA